MMTSESIAIAKPSLAQQNYATKATAPYMAPKPFTTKLERDKKRTACMQSLSVEELMAIALGRSVEREHDSAKPVPKS